MAIAILIPSAITRAPCTSKPADFSSPLWQCRRPDWWLQCDLSGVCRHDGPAAGHCPACAHPGGKHTCPYIRHVNYVLLVCLTACATASRHTVTSFHVLLPMPFVLSSCGMGRNGSHCVLQGGYNLSATAAGVEASLRVCLGERPPPLRPEGQALPAPSPEGLAAIREALITQVQLGFTTWPAWLCLPCCWSYPLLQIELAQASCGNHMQS